MKLDFRTSWYFSTPFRLAGGIFLFVSILIVFVNVYIGVSLLIVGIITLTTQYRLTIDFTSRVYHEYTWVLGIRSGDKTPFETIQYIYINRSKVSQTIALRATQTTIVRDDFNGYLKFSERDKVHLASDESKEDLVKSMKKIASQLNCELLDYTSGAAIRL